MYLSKREAYIVWNSVQPCRLFSFLALTLVSVLRVPAVSGARLCSIGAVQANRRSVTGLLGFFLS